MDRTYMVIDLKSFYASVECVERGLDPMTTKLVVADPERSEKTICLAITPAMKALGIKNRCRVFQIPQGVDYLIAVPRMQLYIEYAAQIYEIYLKYVSKEDIHVYSIDEAFLDITDYLKMYGMTAKELGVSIMNDIMSSTGITATCGIGTNMYLAKVALDISAKHADDHIGYLNEQLYRETLWKHKPLTDFWRIGPGISNRLAGYGISTMKEIAECNEDLLYRIFGIDAELIIDHAWGREITTISDIKNYKPDSTSITSGQVLPRGYEIDEGLVVVKEMADLMCLDLVEKELVTKSITMYLGYESRYNMESSRGSVMLDYMTSSSRVIVPQIEQLYKRIVNRQGQVRRINISFNNLADEAYLQYDLFVDPLELERERNIQKAVLDIKHKFGKNAILKGLNLDKSGTTIERNEQIGGHRK